MFIREGKLLTTYFFISFVGLGFIFAKSSQAQTAIFNFQTTIGGECAFSNIQGGSLQLSEDGKTFSSNVPATATLTCNLTNVSLTLNPPEVSTISAPFNIISSTATATYQENNPITYLLSGAVATGNIVTLEATNSSPDSRTYTGLTLGSSVLRIGGSRTITVNMSATSDTEVSAGLYRFIVRFSAIPQ
ncbi:hypothetical protein [Cyanobacterium aponinum]|uniref:Uncharacterized protein n=1 Tax=Cyanobacterium aponinum (strain PCC 10605) TaxID=755178 RepID=K9Z850_CYAAP|nr:hypothetical protein [Cyanobacterium aponinum]AFZ55324.1 hypothetical protein Cyan10605_3278 [Cyanobacterium aponinum PCC 10605]